ncbi:aminodeoxychorismate/anthranilate synthase component II [Candidatus Hecatella orcuttiae]|uniref:anthranilate synthase component II n=1 Tax=Candidatus Hecatella orcuttiae TaxID=1935119 RepID=UPI002867CCA4|nr:aminodeoxychorismate/anthranilate synthase component II [Candidatus Hecatella orcuttiae]
MKVLFINNRDSFVYILVDYVASQGCKVVVADNILTAQEAAEMRPQRIIISPGPGHPRKSTGNTMAVIRKLASIPILGVCLGHQAIVEAFGGKVDRAESGPLHGKTSQVYHDGKGVFHGLPNPFPATRYHSLAAVPTCLPSCLEVSAKAEDGTIMGVRHKSRPVEGIQFHPESILTAHGKRLIQNFLETPNHYFPDS